MIKPKVCKWMEIIIKNIIIRTQKQREREI